MASSCCLGR
uniref:Uncharacterized protein n=1 Tax=Arundo donax TaxID=35708 RepID=A0A0A9AIG0_ARUDO